jgi:hypothetical protein
LKFPSTPSIWSRKAKLVKNICPRKPQKNTNRFNAIVNFRMLPKALIIAQWWEL